MTQKTSSPYSAAFPGISNDALNKAYVRNFETFDRFSKLLLEGTQSILAAHVAMWQGGLKQLSENFIQAANIKDSKAALQQTLDAVQASANHAMSLTAEVTTIATKTGEQVFDIFRERIKEGVSDLGGALRAA